MSAIINWRVGTMECYPTYEQNIDVVFTVHWDCVGSETVNNITYNGRVYGATGVTYHSGSTFTPYNQLTQDQVIGWVWDSMGTEQKNSYESSVQTQIDNQINPPVVTLTSPWLVTPTPLPTATPTPTPTATETATPTPTAE